MIVDRTYNPEISFPSLDFAYSTVMFEDAEVYYRAKLLSQYSFTAKMI